MKAQAASREGALSLAISDPRGEGTPILFVHGFSHNRSVWSVLGESLPDGWRPISVDLRGHGDSPWSPEGHYDLHDYALDLRALVDSLALPQVHVVGHSLGGNVCTLLMSMIADRARSLTLVDTGPSLAAAASAQIVGEVDAGLRSYGSVAEFREQLSLIHPNGDGEVLDRLASSSVVRRLDGRFEWALDPGVLGVGQGVVDTSALERSLWSALGSIRAPVLLVRGETSSILSEKVAREMVEENLARGRLETLPRAGHAIMIDEGEALRLTLLDFLNEADRAA